MTQAQVESYYQDGIKEPYAGEERRDRRRPSISPADQIILNELRKIQTGCGGCPIPEEIIPHMGHAVAIVREKGINSKGDKIEAGLTRFRDQDKQVEKILSTRTKIVDKAIMVIAIGLLVLGLKKLGWM
jgi:hypothetical protein